MVKMYRTPLALRAFGRIFTLILPPFYAPSFAQVGKDVDSVGYGVVFGMITALGLTALFESLQVIEDPFTAFLALDGIDVREEFEVLNFTQLIDTRKMVFPHAPDYPSGRRMALTGRRKGEAIFDVTGRPPAQTEHLRQTSVASDLTFQETFVDLTGMTEEQQTEQELGLPFEDDEPAGRETSYALFGDEASVLTRRTHRRGRSVASTTRGAGNASVSGPNRSPGHNRLRTRDAGIPPSANRPRLMSGGGLSARMNE